MKPSPALLPAIAAIAIAAALAGCGGETYIGDSSGHHLSLRNNVVTAHAKGQPDATIDATGSLSIGGKPVEVTPAQRALLKTYHDELADIRKAGIEAGKEGAKMAGHAVGDAVSGLMHGDSNRVSSRIEDRAKELKAKAVTICDDMDALQATQDKSAIELPAFKPYATLEVRADRNCRRDASENHD